MKTLLITFFSLSLIFILNGCSSIFSNNYQEATYYDINLNEKFDLENIPSVKISSCDNISGANRKFVFRNLDRSIETNEYIMWLQSPEFSLYKELNCAFANGKIVEQKVDNIINISATILKFEFDKTKQEAVFAVEYNIQLFRKNNGNKDYSLKEIFVNKFKTNSSEDLVDAMNKNINQSIKNLINNIKKINMEQ